MTQLELPFKSAVIGVEMYLNTTKDMLSQTSLKQEDSKQASSHEAFPEI